MNLTQRIRWSALCGAALLLSACGGGGGTSGFPNSPRGISCFHAVLDTAPLSCEREDGQSLGVVAFGERSPAVRLNEDLPLYRFGDLEVVLEGMRAHESATIVRWGSSETGYALSVLGEAQRPTSPNLVALRFFNVTTSDTEQRGVEFSIQIADAVHSRIELRAGAVSEYVEFDPTDTELVVSGVSSGRFALEEYAGKSLVAIVAGEANLFTLTRILEEAP